MKLPSKEKIDYACVLALFFIIILQAFMFTTAIIKMAWFDKNEDKGPLQVEVVNCEKEASE